MSDTAKHVRRQRKLLREIRKHRRPKMKQFHHSSDVTRIVLQNLEFGVVRKSPYLSEWDVSGKCERPVSVQLSGRKYQDVLDEVASSGLDLDVRCRKCTSCLRARAHLWRLRAAQETTHCARTWFGTLTLSPESHQAALERVRAKEAISGIDFDVLPPSEQFGTLTSEIGRDITLYLKRVRKESAATLRYLLVVEKHQSGDPHFHMLIHEPLIMSSVGERTLRKQWILGFSRWKLADPKTAGYVCKYISKSAEARVRASLHYGNTPCGVKLSEEIVDKVNVKSDPKKTPVLFGLT